MKTVKKRRKHLILSIIAVFLISLLAACGNETSKTTNESTKADTSMKTRTYIGENGEVEIPVERKRIAVLAHIYVGNVLKLGITPIAVNEWVKGNKFFGEQLDEVEVVPDGAIEKLIELEPDLIIAFSSDQNLN